MRKCNLQEKLERGMQKGMSETGNAVRERPAVQNAVRGEMRWRVRPGTQCVKSKREKVAETEERRENVCAL